MRKHLALARNPLQELLKDQRNHGKLLWTRVVGRLLYRHLVSRGIFNRISQLVS